MCVCSCDRTTEHQSNDVIRIPSLPPPSDCRLCRTVFVLGGDCGDTDRCRRNGASATAGRVYESEHHNLQEYTYKKITPCDVCSQVLRGKYTQSGTPHSERRRALICRQACTARQHGRMQWRDSHTGPFEQSGPHTYMQPGRRSPGGTKHCRCSHARLRFDITSADYTRLHVYTNAMRRDGKTTLYSHTHHAPQIMRIFMPQITYNSCGFRATVCPDVRHPRSSAPARQSHRRHRRSQPPPNPISCVSCAFPRSPEHPNTRTPRRAHAPGITMPHLQAERARRLRCTDAEMPAQAEAAAAPEEHVGNRQSRGRRRR